MRILIIEDNPMIADTMRHNLKGFYTIDICNTGKKGLARARAKKYDVILLDLRLPDIDGEVVCRKMREEKIKAPIIILSGKGEVESKVEMLNIGADDYITKPFNFYELRARIDVAMRRASNKVPTGIINIDGLVLDPGSRTAHKNGKLIPLRRKEFDLLELLMRYEGQTLTRSIILERIWDVNEHLWGNVVDVHIKYLRDKVDRPFGTKLIKTVHGVGYKIQSGKFSERENLNGKEVKL